MLRFQSTTAALTEGGLPVMESEFYPVEGNRSQAGGVPAQVGVKR